MKIKKYIELPHIEFKIKEIEDYGNFIKNRRYIQVYQKYEYTIVDIVIYREDYANYRFCLSFSLHKQIQRYKSHSDLDSESESVSVDLQHSPECYYELVSKKQEIQEAMEQRSLQLILQTIIGDKLFVW